MRVKELLATIGVSLKESHEPYENEEGMMNRYSFLSLPIREELTKRITSVCKSFGLEDLYYDSFTRRYGMNG